MAPNQKQPKCLLADEYYSALSRPGIRLNQDWSFAEEVKWREREAKSLRMRTGVIIRD